MTDESGTDRDVLTSLPRSRPARRSSRRADTPQEKSTAAKTAPTPKAATPKAAASAKQKAATAARPKPKPQPQTPPQPRRKVPPAGYAQPRAQEPEGGTGPGEIVSTAVQAAGELAHIGLTVSRQALKSALDRLPRP